MKENQDLFVDTGRHGLLSWDLEIFVVDLAFPRGYLDRYTFGVPMLMVIFIVLLDRENKKARAAEDDEQ